MTPDQILRWLMVNAYELYRASLCAGPPSIDELRRDLLNPKVGDLVMETSTLRRPWSIPSQGIGRLMSIVSEPAYTPEQWREAGGAADEPIPHHTIYYIAPIFDDGRRFRWENASFIKVREKLRD
jgi:hypothetical protein